MGCGINLSFARVGDGPLGAGGDVPQNGYRLAKSTIQVLNDSILKPQVPK